MCQKYMEMLEVYGDVRSIWRRQKYMETLEVYGDDLDIIKLTTQLESLKVKFSSDENSIKDITETLKTISVNS